ncbi:hypothetical protein HDV00_003259 [Rhizophlyctis rosea]|nr:hypothetical protein HDV00_003259 [Rhizophlyctis rosea]
MVRGHYLRDLVDDVRCAKGEEKRRVAIELAVKALDREIARIQRFADAKVASLTKLLETVTVEIAKLTSPHDSLTAQTYELRSFSEWYVPERRALVKHLIAEDFMFRKRSGSASTVVLDDAEGLGDSTASSTVQSGRPHKHDLDVEMLTEREKERDELMREFMFAFERKATGMANGRKLKPVRHVTSSIYKFDRDSYLLSSFLTHAHISLHTFISTLDALTTPLTVEALFHSLSQAISETQAWCSVAFSNMMTLFTTLQPDPEDFTCPICLSLFHAPVIIPSCRHRFCKTCLTSHYRANTYWSYMWYEDVTCPICRAEWCGFKRDRGCENLVKTYFPREYSQQAHDARIEEFRSGIRMRVRLMKRRLVFWGGWF